MNELCEETDSKISLNIGLFLLICEESIVSIIIAIATVDNSWIVREQNSPIFSALKNIWRICNDKVKRSAIHESTGFAQSNMFLQLQRIGNWYSKNRTKNKLKDMKQRRFCNCWERRKSLSFMITLSWLGFWHLKERRSKSIGRTTSRERWTERSSESVLFS